MALKTTLSSGEMTETSVSRSVNRRQLQAAYGLTILWPDPGDLDAFTFFRQEIHEAPLARMQDKGMAFVMPWC